MQYRSAAARDAVKDAQERGGAVSAAAPLVPARWPWVGRLSQLRRRWGIDAEELANTLSHGVGVVLALAGMAVLIWQTAQYGDALHLAAVCVYGLSIVLVFAASTLYHATTSERLKRVFLWLDHSCIYAAIAGTYTPFMLTVLRGWLGFTVLGAVWALGTFGVLSKTVLKVRSDWISIPFYLLMGWLVVAVIRPLTLALEPQAIVLLASGGLCFSLGIVFFLMRRAYAHMAWHLTVLLGTVLHFWAVLLYAKP
jgi:hemolysin III